MTRSEQLVSSGNLVAALDFIKKHVKGGNGHGDERGPEKDQVLCHEFKMRMICFLLLCESLPLSPVGSFRKSTQVRFSDRPCVCVCVCVLSQVPSPLG